MRSLHNVISKFTRMAMGPALSRPAAGPLLRGQQTASTPPRRLLQRMENCRKRLTAGQSMKEFFMHPLTWDRNNGYLNVVLGLAIFTFVFINSCTPCPEDRVPKRKKVDE